MNTIKTTLLSLITILTMARGIAQSERLHPPHIYGVYDLDSNGKTDDMVFSLYDPDTELHTLYQQKYNQDTQAHIGERQVIPLINRIDETYPAYSNLRAYDIDKDGDLDLYFELARKNWDEEYHTLLNTEGTFIHNNTLLIKNDVYPQPVPLHKEYGLITDSTKKFVDDNETIFSVRRSQYGEESKQFDLFSAVIEENPNKNESKYLFSKEPRKMGAFTLGSDFNVSYYTGDFDNDKDIDYKVRMKHESESFGMDIFYLNISPHTSSDKAVLDQYGIPCMWIEKPQKF